MNKNLVFSIIFYALVIALTVISFITKANTGSIPTYYWLADAACLCVGSVFIGKYAVDRKNQDKA